MREFAFTLEFEPGEDPLTDRFSVYEGVASQALACLLSDDRMVRLEQVAGPADALADVKPLLLDSDRRVESISEQPCTGTQYHGVLDDRRDHCTVYSLLDGIERCHTIPALANRYLELGTLCRLRRRGRRQQWRILMRDESRVGLLFETIHEKLRDGVTFRFDHLTEAAWTDEPLPSTTLPGKQREALEAAVEHGYYETPRALTLDDLASALDLPRSTLSYRLRKAEERLAKEYAASTP
jgi:predicted DNA binding protein